MTKLVCTTCGALHKAPFRPEVGDYACTCGGRRVLPSQAKPRKPLARAQKPMKRGKGMSADRKQQAKVRELVCAYCGVEGYEGNPLDAAHLTDRSMGGCAHPDCVIPLCRTHHEALHAHTLELLPALVERGYWREMAHAIEAHQVSPYTLVDRLTLSDESALPSPSYTRDAA